MRAGGRQESGEAELRALNERYFNALDRRDFDALGACFTETATAEYLGGDWRLDGREDIVDRLRVVASFDASVHVPATMSLTVGDGTASGEVFAVAYLSVSGAAGPHVVVRGLRYSDDYVDVRGVWQIGRRRQDPLWQYEVARVPSAIPSAGDGPPPTGP